MLSTPQNSPPDGRRSASDEELATGLASVRQRIDAAAAQSGRDVRSITLLAVTKGQPAARIRTALSLGLTQFGENYLGEALPKIQALAGTTASWHFIGRLQANKTRDVAEHFTWVHSVDRLRVAERLSAQRPQQSAPLNICVQVHIAEDPEKGGVAPDALLPLLRAIAPLPRLHLRGLMCLLPYEAPEPVQRACFARLALLADAARAAGVPLDTLSMGMSADLEAAIRAGATMVRIGTALFGARDS
ncbi:MAG: YggS family pyridoxal phosphate-dependent enzyme [Steroidobacteraceae bacterium]